MSWKSKMDELILEMINKNKTKQLKYEVKEPGQETKKEELTAQ